MRILHFLSPITQRSAGSGSLAKLLQAQSSRVHHANSNLLKIDTITLLERHDEPKKRLVAHWVMDEHSKLHAQWVLED